MKFFDVDDDAHWDRVGDSLLGAFVELDSRCVETSGEHLRFNQSVNVSQRSVVSDSAVGEVINKSMGK
jgi:hypothetical protein